MKLLKSFVFICVICMATNLLTKQDINNLTELIQKLSKSDGGETFELNYKISKALVANDSLFFKVMNAHQQEFQLWLDDLDTGTFTIFNAEDDVDIILYTAMLAKLKELMLEKTDKYLNHPKYKKLAQKVKERLSNISVRSID